MIEEPCTSVLNRQRFQIASESTFQDRLIVNDGDTLKVSQRRSPYHDPSSAICASGSFDHSAKSSHVSRCCRYSTTASDAGLSISKILIPMKRAGLSMRFCWRRMVPRPKALIFQRAINHANEIADGSLVQAKLRVIVGVRLGGDDLVLTLAGGLQLRDAIAFVDEHTPVR